MWLPALTGPLPMIAGQPVAEASITGTDLAVGADRHEPNGRELSEVIRSMGRLEGGQGNADVPGATTSLQGGLACATGLLLTRVVGLGAGGGGAANTQPIAGQRRRSARLVRSSA